MPDRQADESAPGRVDSPDPASGYPDAIPLVLSEAELVELQVALGWGNEGLRLKLRAFQLDAFSRSESAARPTGSVG